MAATKNEQIVMDFFETLSRGDMDGLRKILNKHATWTVMAKNIPGAGEHKGRKAIIDDFIAPIRGIFEPGDPKLEVTNMVSKGNLVMAEAVGRGRLKNGREYHNLYCWVFETKGTKLIAIREYMDSEYVTTLQ